MIKDNIEDVRYRIKMACERAGRDINDVTLLAVSKTKPIDMIEEAIKVGQHCFGENKVQEITYKYEDMLNNNVSWHMIGHLQTNKVKYIVDKVDMIHSKKKKKLANIINKEAQKKNIIMDVLVEVNVANEDSKFGISKN